MSFDYLTYKTPREDRACVACGFVRKVSIYGGLTGNAPWWKRYCAICEKKHAIRKHQRHILNLQGQVLELQNRRARALAKKGKKS